MSNSKSVSLQWLGLLFSLAGLTYCLTALTERGSQALCLTSGCSLFSQVKIFGFSPWWFGSGAFLLIALLCLQGKRSLPFAAACLFLLLDCFFLFVMIFAAPCVSCLGVALLFCATCLVLRPKASFSHKTAPRSKRFMVLLFIWSVLFSGNAANALNELLPLWALENPQNSNYIVYFSPTCQACQEAVNTLGGSAIFYPISKDPGDLQKIARMEDLLEEGLPLKAALPQMLEEAAKPGGLNYSLSMQRSLLLQWRLLRNKARLTGDGFTAVPVVQINGFPRKLFGRQAIDNPPAPHQPSYSDAQGSYSIQPGLSQGTDLPQFADNLEQPAQCREGAEIPCDQPDDSTPISPPAP